MCKLRAEACKQKKAIIVLKNGTCGGESNPSGTVWGFKRDQVKASPPETVWGFKRDQANSDEPEDVRGAMEDEDARLPDEEEDEDDDDAYEDDDQD